MYTYIHAQQCETYTSWFLARRSVWAQCILLHAQGRSYPITLMLAALSLNCLFACRLDYILETDIYALFMQQGEGQSFGMAEEAEHILRICNARADEPGSRSKRCFRVGGGIARASPSMVDLISVSNPSIANPRIALMQAA